MTARIVHFGVDDSDLLRALRDAGYSVENCIDLTGLQALLKSNRATDAVAIDEGHNAVPAEVIRLCRRSFDAPLILFQGRNSNANHSEFSLVVPFLAPTSKWLNEIALLVERSRAKRAKSQLERKEAGPLRDQASATVERLRREGGPAARQRKTIASQHLAGCVTIDLPHRNLPGLRIGQFLMSMSEQALLDFQSLASISSCSPGSVLFFEGRLPRDVYILLEGQVKLFMNSSDGRRLTVHIAGPGEILGLPSAFTAATHRTTAETLHHCKFASLSCEEFLKFVLAHPDASQSAARELGESCDRTYARLRTIGVTPSNRAKLARLLLEWSAQGKQTEHGIQIHLALKHGEIGECIGTCRESVTRILRDLQRSSVIELHGSLLTIADQSALERCAALK